MEQVIHFFDEIIGSRFTTCAEDGSGIPPLDAMESEASHRASLPFAIDRREIGLDLATEGADSGTLAAIKNIHRGVKIRINLQKYVRTNLQKYVKKRG